ncbi:MAG: NAD(P)/FAD-dependent oxidoreductase [Bacteroidetes bacterium]|nr:NAD(P)/FAD-dependent oxidoreductase [Bacteroidota bacterium]
MNDKEIYDLIVIGGGASGFFGAIHAKLQSPNAKVGIIEMHSRFLSKVAVSGGGRCNLTHHCFEPNILVKNYPRGYKELLSVFNIFQPKDTIEWFEERGVKTKIEEDGRMFPISNSSASIIDCLMAETKRLDIKLFDSVKVVSLKRGDVFQIETNRQSFLAENILLACGGISNSQGLKFLETFNLEWVSPVPSLFSFHIKQEKLNALSGISLQKVAVKVQGSKNIYDGPLVITHQGLSGPAILKTSAYEALKLNEANYQFPISINWVALKEHIVREDILKYKAEHALQKVFNSKLFDLPQRLWIYMLEKANMNAEIIWAEQPSKNINKLIETLINDAYEVSGKSPNKEEFVTAGGIDLKSVDFKTMQIKNVPGLYASGEILNVDGITGGFNFQAAWSTGFVAGTAIGKKIESILIE